MQFIRVADLTHSTSDAATAVTFCSFYFFVAHSAIGTRAEGQTETENAYKNIYAHAHRTT